jgi:cytidylate kinase
MKITITGTAGSGKSIIAKTLAKKLGYKHLSMGDFQRELAKEHNMTILEWGKHEATDKKYDLMVDKKQVKFGQENNHFVIDSWLGAKFIPDSFKIFLDADIDIRVKRRLIQKRNEENFSEYEETKRSILERQNVNRERWIKYYQFDYEDKDNYDLIIDTTNLSIEEIIDMIINKIKNTTKDLRIDEKIK